MKMLKSQLYEIELRKKMEARQEIESSKMKIEWGSQIRNYVMHPYKLVKDVRTGQETGNVDNVMDGDIDQFLKAFLMMMGQKEEEYIIILDVANLEKDLKYLKILARNLK